jgi:hypothetical protein
MTETTPSPLIGVMGLAYEIVATKIIELAKANETNPDLLCEETLNYFQQHL